MGLTRLRLAVLLVGYAVLGAAAGAVFDEFLWVLFVAPIVPLVLVGVVVAMRPWIRVTAAVTGVIAATVLAVVSKGGGRDDLVDAFTAGVQRLLSTEWPSPRTPDLVGAVAAGLAATSAISALLVTARKWHLMPLLPLIVGYVATVGLSAPVGIRPAVLIVECIVCVGFATLRPDTTLRERTLLLRGERRLIPLLGIAALLSLALSLPIYLTDRADPRRSEPASESAALLGPIQTTIALRALDPSITLHEIESAGPTDLPIQWRTAALTNYDGRRWTPEITLRPIGSTLGPVTGETVDVAISFLDSDLRLVPLPGDPVSVSAAVETDVERTVVRLVERPAEGDVVDLVSNVAEQSGIVPTSVVAVRPVDENVAGLSGFAESLAGEGTLIEQLRTIEQTLREEYVLDSATPGGGLQRVLIDRFLRDTERGNREQFATAFVLLARALGVDARVATGFLLDQPVDQPADQPADAPVGQSTDQQLSLTSADAAIWPEVGLADGTWVRFDPTPVSEASDGIAPPEEPQVQTPAAPQPPIARPPDPPSEAPDADSDPDDADSVSGSFVRVWAGRSATAIGIVGLPLLVAASVITLLKRRRRRRRLRAPDPTQRIRGAWAAATDDLVDAGVSINASATDREIASGGESVAPDARRELHRLAALSGAATFGSPVNPDLLSQDATTCLDTIDTAIAAERTRWQRLRWRLSLRSLRSATRSPVRV